MKPNGARRRRRIDVPRRGNLLRSDQYANCAKRHSVSSSEAKPWALYLTRMRVNAQEEKRKHGITCDTSSPLEKGRAEGAGWMCLEEAPFCAADSMISVQSATPYRQRKRSREIFAALVCDVTSRLRNESTVLHMIRAAPWRRGAPKAQDGCASKRHPSMQRSVCQLCKALLRIVIESVAEKSLSFAVSWSMFGNSKRETCYPLTFGHRPIYIAAKLPPQPRTLNPLPFLKTLHVKNS